MTISKGRADATIQALSVPMVPLKSLVMRNGDRDLNQSYDSYPLSRVPPLTRHVFLILLCGFSLKSPPEIRVVEGWVLRADDS